jgi:glutathione peroxidase
MLLLRSPVPVAAALAASLLGPAACDRDSRTTATANPHATANANPTATATTNAASNRGTMTDAPSLHTLTAKRLDGKEEALSSYAGKVLLVVNTASECGYTPQYEGLQKLHGAYKDRGFSVLGFPSNDFGGQEPGSSTEIATFCKTKFGVDFPLFEKVTTKGEGQSPVYALLSSAKGPPKWNFHKYLVDKAGKVVAAWPSSVKPDSPEITGAIDRELAAK